MTVVELITVVGLLADPVDAAACFLLDTLTTAPGMGAGIVTVFVGLGAFVDFFGCLMTVVELTNACFSFLEAFGSIGRQIEETGAGSGGSATLDASICEDGILELHGRVYIYLFI